MVLLRHLRVAGRRRAHATAIVALAAVLAGCAARPGPEVLVPTAATPGAKLQRIYVATTRTRTTPSDNVFTSDRATALNFASFKVAIPPGHASGNIEWPEGTPDPRVNFVTADQAVLSDAEFRDEVAPTRQRGAKRKVLIFVHGFNNNFQESLYRLAQVHADASMDSVPILFAWPSQGRVAAYAEDKDAATVSRDDLIALLKMVANSPQVGDIMVLGHSMGCLVIADALSQLRSGRQDRVIARLRRVILAAPDIDVDVFRAQLQTIGPLSPPMTLLVSKDDKALGFSNFIGGSRARAGALDIENPAVREAALKAKVQVVDISTLQSRDRMNHSRFTALAELYPRLQRQPASEREQAGIFVIDANSATVARPFEAGNQAAVH
jgi:esterase/lipase superfamily enzyme